MTERRDHWDRVYRDTADTSVSWYEADPALSLAAVQKNAGPEAAVIDIGGGAARLVDRLIAAGYRDLTVLDISEAAQAVSRARLGAAGDAVTWIAADVTRWTPPRAYALWHDRAVFHFLTDPADRRAYAGALSAGLAPGGTAVIFTMADDGPARCSGLPVARYAPDELADEFARLAPGLLVPVGARRFDHPTPGGAVQRFQMSLFRRA